MLVVPSGALRQVRDDVHLAFYWKHQNPANPIARCEDVQVWWIIQISSPRSLLRILPLSLQRRSGSSRWGGGSRELETTRPHLRFLRAFPLCRRRLPRARFVVASIAWQQPHLLTEKLQYTKLVTKNVPTSQAINQAKQNAILVAQMEIPGDASVEDKASLASKSSTRSHRSCVSSTSSQSTDRSELTAASAHCRRDNLGESMLDMHCLLKQLAVQSNLDVQAPSRRPNPSKLQPAIRTIR